MSHITGHERTQTLLLPESLDEYVGPENPVRFIDAFAMMAAIRHRANATTPPKTMRRTARPKHH